MFEMAAQPRYSELSEAREQLNRRLDIYTQQYKAKEAQYAELGIVRKRNLEKVLRTLQRQGKLVVARSWPNTPSTSPASPLFPPPSFPPETIASSRSEALAQDYQRFQSSSRMALQSSLDGTSQAQRALHNLQSSYYQQMQRMMPAWEEHKTKLKLKKLSMLQSHKTKLEQQRLRVAELSKYNQELDSRLYQFADQVQVLERQVMDESSGHLDQQRTRRLREQQDRDRRYRLEAEVQRALKE